MEHLLNCHGEWTFLLTFIDSWPLTGTYVRNWFGLRHNDAEGEHNESG
jgi:hypothetical protein